MDLHITRFKKLEGVSISYELGTVNLLQGPGGSGKSSIMEALAFVLYDNSDHIQNLFASAGCLVSLHLRARATTIIRRTVPKLLKVEIGGKSYVDDAAQSFIDDIFGSREIFELCSYAAQVPIPNLLQSSSSKQRLKYLTALAFRNHYNPAKFIKDASTTLKRVKTEYETALRAYEEQIAKFTEQLAVRPVDPEWKLFTPTEINARIMVIDSELRLLYGLRAKNEVISSTIAGLRTELADKTRTLVGLKEQLLTLRIEPISIDLLEARFRDLTELKGKYRTQLDRNRATETANTRLATIRAQCAAVEAKIGSVGGPALTERDYLRIEHHYHEHTSGARRSRGLGVEYSESALRSAKQTTEEYIRYRTMHDEWTKYRDLIGKLDKLSGVEDRVNSLQAVERELSCPELRCPACDTSLRLVAGPGLVRSGSAVRGTEELARIRAQLAEALEQKRVLEATRVELTGVVLANPQIDTWSPNPSISLTLTLAAAQDRLLKLNDIKYLETPDLSLETARLLVDRTKLRDLLAAIPVPVTDPDDEATTPDLEAKFQAVTTELEQITASLRDQRAISSRLMTIGGTIELLEPQIAKLANQISGLEQQLEGDVPERLVAAEETKLRIGRLVSGVEYAGIMTGRRAELEAENNRIMELRADVMSLTELYKIGVDRQYERLREVVNTINSTLAKCAQFVFPFQVTVKLGLQRFIKGSGGIEKIKHEVNLEVIYQGVTCDANKYFSFSQKKRLSLLLAIALNNIHYSPLILFDELLTNMSPEERVLCVQAIKDFLQKDSDRVVVCAEYQADESDYDSVRSL